MSRAKRFFDVTVSAVGLLALAPIFATIAVVIKLGDGGEIFFWHRRVGRGGTQFNMLKFRSMTAARPEEQTNLTIGIGGRITKAGAWLRRTKLDELPQLLNVLRGEMSLVGPRPEVPHYTGYYTSGQLRVFDLVPGVTDPASMKYWDEAALLSEFADPEAAYIEHLIPEKIRINLAYASSATLWSDLQVILGTVLRLTKCIRSPGTASAALPPRPAVQVFGEELSA
jgi:lipopolysaccharide/colanic/teichoic acid biosynthesis glycosyltransferase